MRKRILELIKLFRYKILTLYFYGLSFLRKYFITFRTMNYFTFSPSSKKVNFFTKKSLEKMLKAYFIDEYIKDIFYYLDEIGIVTPEMMFMDFKDRQVILTEEMFRVFLYEVVLQVSCQECGHQVYGDCLIDYFEEPLFYCNSTCVKNAQERFKQDIKNDV